MDTFVQRLQPDKYKSWLRGSDYGYHPENPYRVCLIPKPSNKDIMSNIK